ncbi:24379_t:CDS:2 [Cetraspora pellucida]|uniref:24379_t:CDS:1 n=1 Tax=Cetraspora pellucida TaxID=1433469 RepID=A0A9N9A7K7_9GLOM|nr:24379_t:CDS:2 [Cetraspora pellucida]
MTDKCFVIGALLYEDYDILDYNGTIRFLGSLYEEQNLNVKIITISQNGGKYDSRSQCSNWSDYSFDNCPEFNVLLIPGGRGYIKHGIENPVLMDFINKWIPKVEYVLMVCTASAIVAKTGHLDGKNATSNKTTFDTVVCYGPNVKWIKHARWVVDGKFYTSGGVSAGMDMVLGWISDVFGEKYALAASHFAEYVWNSNPALDPFSGMNFKQNSGILDFQLSSKC